MMHGSYNDQGDRPVETFLISLETGRRRNIGNHLLLGAVASAFNYDAQDPIIPWSIAYHEVQRMAFEGKTYSLFNGDETSAGYYAAIRQLADDFLRSCPDAEKLLALIRKAVEGVLQRHLKISSQDRQTLSSIRETLKDSLWIYTKNVEQHLKTLPASRRLDATLATREEQYHLYMLEIELVNRIYRDEFKNAEYKFALIAHCLRDFRPECRAEP